MFNAANDLADKCSTERTPECHLPISVVTYRWVRSLPKSTDSCTDWVRVARVSYTVQGIASYKNTASVRPSESGEWHQRQLLLPSWQPLTFTRCASTKYINNFHTLSPRRDRDRSRLQKEARYRRPKFVDWGVLFVRFHQFMGFLTIMQI